MGKPQPHATVPSLAAGERRDASALADEFRRNGYVVDRGVIGPTELAELRREAGSLIQAHAEPSRHTVHTEGRPWKVNFITDPSQRQHNESLGLLAAHPRIMQVVQELIGRRVALWMQSLTYKHPEGGPPVPRHRDTFVNQFDSAQTHVVLNADIYLDDATADNGCLRVVPGSHLLSDVRDLVDRDADDWSGMVPVEVRAGDVAYHNDLTVHGSPATPPHDGTGIRRLVLNVYVDPHMLATHGLVPGMVPTRRVVQNAVSMMNWWVERRREVYGDVDYELERWELDEGTAPVFEPDDWGLGFRLDPEL